MPDTCDFDSALVKETNTYIEETPGVVCFEITESGTIRGWNVWVEDYEDGYAYQRIDTESPCYTLNLVIPTQVDGITVKTIGENAFSRYNLNSVTLSNSVTEIEYEAFYFSGLSSVTLSNSLISIGSSAFSRNNLSSVTIPNSVTTIENSAFDDNNISSLTLSENLTNIGAVAFSRNNLTSLTIPASVNLVENAAFTTNQLTRVDILSPTTTIGWGVFCNNPGLTLENIFYDGTLPDNLFECGT